MACCRFKSSLGAARHSGGGSICRIAKSEIYDVTYLFSSYVTRRKVILPFRIQKAVYLIFGNSSITACSFDAEFMVSFRVYAICYSKIRY